jgi:hypothetical protein
MPCRREGQVLLPLFLVSIQGGAVLFHHTKPNTPPALLPRHTHLGETLTNMSVLALPPRLSLMSMVSLWLR